MRLAAAFEAWVSQNLLPPLEVLAEGPERVEYAFVGVTRAITVVVSERGLSIVAAGPGQDCWDLLLDCEVAPGFSENGVHCLICTAEGKEVYFESEEALFEDHVLAHLQTWCVTKLLQATHLRLGQQGGFTWAELVRHSADAEAITPLSIPIREVT